MRKVISIAAALVGVLAVATAGAQTVAERIEQAVTPLPDELKADATVYDYNEDGVREVLRQGSNHIECKPRDERGFTLCFPVSSSARRDYSAALAAEGLEDEELQAALEEAEAEGSILPTQPGSILYRLYEEDDRIKLLWVVLLPNAMAADLGMSVESQRDPSLAGMGRPWMMREGTPGAHLMIPINGTDLSNKGDDVEPLDTKSIDDPVAHAVLPLPADLRDGAGVIAYDEQGNRKVLREGTNMMECQVRDENSGFTRCYHKNLGTESDLRARLSAEGKTVEEMSAAINVARGDGTLMEAPFGSLAYRLYEEEDRLKLLWVMRLPNAMSTDLGMSIASQRDPSLDGEGLPWMMREGTPGAHLMIPINGTELSNQNWDIDR
jgi:DNA-binding transcriptional MerR regulator